MAPPSMADLHHDPGRRPRPGRHPPDRHPVGGLRLTELAAHHRHVNGMLGGGRIPSLLLDRSPGAVH